MGKALVRGGGLLVPVEVAKVGVVLRAVALQGKMTGAKFVSILERLCAVQCAVQPERREATYVDDYSSQGVVSEWRSAKVRSAQCPVNGVSHNWRKHSRSTSPFWLGKFAQTASVSSSPWYTSATTPQTPSVPPSRARLFNPSLARETDSRSRTTPRCK